MEQINNMTPRERVMKAFEFKSSDRIPVDLSGHRSSGRSASLYPKSRKALGLKPRPVRIYDPVQQLAVLDNDVLNILGIDTIELGRAFATKDDDWSPWILPDGTDCFLPKWVNPEREESRWIIRSNSGRIIAQMPDRAQFFEQLWYPFYEEDSDRSDINAAMDESMWHTVVSPPGPLTDGDEGEK